MILPFLKSDPGTDPVIAQNEIHAPPARVFRAWTHPDDIVRWFGRAPNTLASAQIDLRVGGLWRFTFETVNGTGSALSGEYLTVDAERRLVFTWRHERWVVDGEREETPPSEVTVTFEPVDAGTLLTVRHQGIVTSAGRSGVGEGWNDSLQSLEALMAEQRLADIGR